MKTEENNASVKTFLNGITDDRRRDDAFAVLEMMASVTGKAPKMWGTSIVGFDAYRYKYENGREGEMCMIGFSPRKKAMTLYITDGFAQHSSLLEKLGTHTTGQSCLYIKKLTDVDIETLRQIVTESYRQMQEKYR